MMNNNQYSILQNSQGDVLLIVKPGQSAPTTPYLFYDGGDAMLLYRGDSDAVLLKHVEDEARLALSSVDEILVVERDDEELVRSYVSKILRVSDVRSLIE